MSVKVQLPPGCEGLTMQDGSVYSGRPGGSVTVSDDHARWIHGGDGALVQASNRVFAGTRNGRWCTACQPPRLWNAWSVSCPRCNAPTEPEGSA